MDDRLKKIASGCYLKVSANNGYLHREYFEKCIYDSLKEAEKRTTKGDKTKWK